MSSSGPVVTTGPPKIKNGRAGEPLAQLQLTEDVLG